MELVQDDRWASATVEVPVDPDEAFRVFTDEVDAWYVADGGARLTSGGTEDPRPSEHAGPRNAATVRFLPVSPSARPTQLVEGHDRASGAGRELARVEVWEPGRRLVLATKDGELVVITFTAIPRGTRVTITPDGLEPAAGSVRNGAVLLGWPHRAGRYERHLRHDSSRATRRGGRHQVGGRVR